MHIFKDIYDYRELLKTNIKKDIRGKYKGSFLGVLWSFINPLLQVVVYWIVFPYLMRGAGGDNYLVYLITGLIPWTFFLTTVSAGTTSIKFTCKFYDFLCNYLCLLFRFWIWHFHSSFDVASCGINTIYIDSRYNFDS